MNDVKRLLKRIPNAVERASSKITEEEKEKRSLKKRLILGKNNKLRFATSEGDIQEDQYFMLSNKESDSSQIKISRRREAGLNSLKEYLFARDLSLSNNMSELQSSSKLASKPKLKEEPLQLKNRSYIIKNLSLESVIPSSPKPSRDHSSNANLKTRLPIRQNSVNPRTVDFSQEDDRPNPQIDLCFKLCSEIRNHILTLWSFMDNNLLHFERMLLTIFEDSQTDKAQKAILRQILSGDGVDQSRQWPGTSLEPIVLIRLLNINHGCQRIWVDRLM